MKIALYATAASLIATASFAGGLAAPVITEQPVVAMPAPVAISDWTGFYAGLGFGAGEYSSDATAFTDTDLTALGLHAGYQWDFGQFVAGAELDYNELNVDGFNDRDSLLRLRARAGYDMGRVLPYVNLGVARLDSVFAEETGLTYGIGVDFKVTESISMGLEYSRNQFDEFNGAEDLNLDLIQLRASYRF